MSEAMATCGAVTLSIVTSIKCIPTADGNLCGKLIVAGSFNLVLDVPVENLVEIDVRDWNKPVVAPRSVATGSTIGVVMDIEVIKDDVVLFGGVFLVSTVCSTVQCIIHVHHASYCTTHCTYSATSRWSTMGATTPP
jgi:hypothetical protein